MNGVNKVFDQGLSVLDNQIVSSVLGLFLVLYAGLAAPKLPRKIAELFDNMVFRVVILFLVAYMSSKNKSVALIAAVGLMISFQTLNRHKINDKIVKIMEEEIDEADEEEDIITPHMEEKVPVARSDDKYAEISQEHGYTEDEENIAEVLGEESHHILGEDSSTWAPISEMEETHHAEEEHHSVKPVHHRASRCHVGKAMPGFEGGEFAEI
jgi:hypothetical protein